MPHSPQRISQLPLQWRRAILDLDAALEQNAPGDYSEQIDLIGKQMFGSLWDLKPGDPMPDDLKSYSPAASERPGAPKQREGGRGAPKYNEGGSEDGPPNT